MHNISIPKVTGGRIIWKVGRPNQNW